MSSVGGSRSPRRRKERYSKRSSLSPRHKFPVFFAAENVVREQSIFSRRMPVSEVFYMVAAKATEKPAPSKATHALFLAAVGPTGEPIRGSEVEMEASCRMKQFMSQINDGSMVVFKHRALPISFSYTKTFLVDGRLSCSAALAWMMAATPAEAQGLEGGCGDQLFPTDLDGSPPLAGHEVTVAAVDLATVRFFLPSPSRASAVILAFFHVFSPSSLPLPPTVSSPAATHSDRHNLPPLSLRDMFIRD